MPTQIRGNAILPSDLKIAIALCTHNGGRYLGAQLQSIAAQSHRNWHLYISDDGSADDTLQIAGEFASRHPGRVDVRQGPRFGATANFLSVVTDPAVEADAFAYADQDDVWDADKLERSARWLTSVPAETPALWGSRTRLIDETGQPLGYSPMFKRRPGFCNALVQNIAGGNTMAFNRAARDVLAAATPIGFDIVAHDWWTYKIVSGAGGCVHYDPQPSLSYRQHDSNLVGSNDGLQAKIKRLRMLFRGRLAEWNDVDVKALQARTELLTADNRLLLDQFQRLRSDSVTCRVRALSTGRFYRQTRRGQMGLWLAVTLGLV